MHCPTWLGARQTPGGPTRVVIIVGDDEPVWEDGIAAALRLVANVAPASGSAAYGVDHV